jgi:hypothetical protein
MLTAEQHRAVAGKLWCWFDKREIEEAGATAICLLLAAQMICAKTSGEAETKRGIRRAMRTLQQEARQDEVLSA